MTTHGDQSADLVVTGADVVTLDDSDSRAEAMAVRDGRIVAVGADAMVRRHIGPATRVMDLPDRTVIPGINDSHLHATWLGALWPTTLMGPSAGEFPEGRLVTGVRQRRAAILRAGEVCAALGITSYTEPGLGPGEDDGETGCFGQEVLEDYAALAQRGELRARVTVLRLFGTLDGPSDVDSFERGIDTPVPRIDPEWLNVAGVKVFADGIPPMRTAWTRHSYPDETTGRLLVDGADDAEREANMRRMIELAHARGLQVGVHATGDRSIQAVLDAVEQSTARHGHGGRHYIVHGDLVTSEQLRRMAALGVGVTMQPGIAVATAAQVAAALGESVAEAAWPLDEMLESGTALTLSSDGPILRPDWRAQIAAAGEMLAEAEEPSTLMSRLLRCYTSEAARQDGAEDWKGTLERGKVADFCVLARNPLSIRPGELPDVPIETTVTGGRTVYDRSAVGVRVR